VQRQIWPDSASAICSRLGAGVLSSSHFAAINMPGVQYPHWAAP
jgi:hypothetical protein